MAFHNRRSARRKAAEANRDHLAVKRQMKGRDITTKAKTKADGRSFSRFVRNQQFEGGENIPFYPNKTGPTLVRKDEAKVSLRANGVIVITGTPEQLAEFKVKKS